MFNNCTTGQNFWNKEGKQTVPTILGEWAYVMYLEHEGGKRHHWKVSDVEHEHEKTVST